MSARSKRSVISRFSDWRFSRGRTRTVAGVLVLILGLNAIGLGFFLNARDSGEGGGAEQPAGSAAGITIDVPAGWADRTEELAGQTPDVRPVKVFVGPTTGGYASLMNVVHRPREDGHPRLVEMARLARQNLADSLGGDVDQARETSVGGEAAYAYDYRYQAEGVPLAGRQVVTYHGEDVLFLNLIAHQDAFGRDVAALEEVAGSLRWSG